MTNETAGGRKPPITPYKGGRTARVYIRATDEVKARAEALAAREGVSVADLFERWVNETFTAQPNNPV